MVGRIDYRREKGRGELTMEGLGPLTVAAVPLFHPPGLSRRRLERRLARLEGKLAALGVGRVVLPGDFPLAGQLHRLRPVDPLPLYRGAADVLAMGVLEGLGVDPRRARVALQGSWLCPELCQAAWRLCPRVRAVRIDVPGGGEDFARALRQERGLPVEPPGGHVDVTLAFSPGTEAEGPVLGLYHPMALGEWRLAAAEVPLPRDWAQQGLELLWEAGAVRREALRAVREKRPDGQFPLEEPEEA